MLKKIGQIFFLVLLLSGVAIVQFSFIFPLPTIYSQINLAAIVLVFNLFFFDFRSALYASLILGFWLDLYSFNFFGFYLLLFFFTILLANWILKTWLTNRSLYSFLLLILLAALAYNLFSGFLSYFSGTSSGGFFLWRASFWSNLFYGALWSELAGLLMFSLAGALTRRFQPFFLEKK
jgi:cell shape-determining protein MreD